MPSEPNFVDDIANQELIQIARKNGFDDLIEAMLDDAIYIKSSGRLNHSALARRLNIKSHLITGHVAELRAFMVTLCE